MAKVIRQYALTSANDFPQRDPKNWRLQGSNDGGNTWLDLDVRKGESFLERHQRRVFTVTNSGAFATYRLLIDCVRDPASADAVQLADIELMGESNEDFSPTPIFCDLITAQGENPPVETAYKAFDSEIETKWLDQAGQHPATRSSWIQWQYIDHSQLVITNINQLMSLKTRANEDYLVRITAVVFGRNSGADKLWVMDPTGTLEIEANDREAKFNPGQHVLIGGKSEWKRGVVGIRNPEMQVLGRKASDNSTLITPGQAIMPEQDDEWVDVEGQAQFPTHSGQGLDFELIKNGRSMTAHILQVDPLLKPQLSGTSVRVRGLCEKALDENGNWVAGVLWIPSLDSVSPMSQTGQSGNGDGHTTQGALNAESGSLITRIDQIRHLAMSELTISPRLKDLTLPELANILRTNDLTPLEIAASPSIKVRGVVTESLNVCVQDATGGIEVWNNSEASPWDFGFGDYVEVEGHAILAPGHGVTGYGPVIRVTGARLLGRGKLPEPLQPSWSLLVSGQMNAQWIEVEAVVRATDGSHLLLACEGGQLMATIRSAPASQVNQLVDATVRVRGVSLPASERGQMQGVHLVIPSMAYVAVEQAPGDIASLSPRRIDSLHALQEQGELTHRVKVNGVLTYFDRHNFFIQDKTAGAMAIAKQDVTLSLAAGAWWSFWQNPKNETAPAAENEFKVGDQVEAVGFPETRGYAAVLSQAIVTKGGSCQPAVAVKATAVNLAKGELDSLLVTLDGRVVGSESLGPVFILQIQSDQKAFQAFLPLGGRDKPKIPSGSRVRITGVCQMEPAAHGELGQSPSAFSLLLREPSDISLLEPPPWLTVRRTLPAAGALAVVLLGAFVWIRLLRHQVEVRTQQLREEIAEHEKTEGLLARKTELLVSEIERHEKTEASLAEKTELLKEEIRERGSIYAELEDKKLSLEREIEERKRIQAEAENIHKQLLSTSRMAGMADLATNVLHNVGNVLNGVNVLAASIATYVHNSKVPGVSRVAALLAEHREDLGRFVTDDANGRHVPGHLERLGNHLKEEQSRLLKKVNMLSESVHHIKEIVAVQQNYAKASGLSETVLLPDIIEDALKMCSEAFLRHEIKVVRDYEKTPPATLDRHKVLQILFNLLDNAIYACEAAKTPEKEITIRIRKHSAGNRFQIQVADNGVGIPAGNLPSIFMQGFSTRSGGHGFGLHSSLLAAQEMGGSLNVQTGGPDCGATFTLELPLEDSEQNSEEPSGVETVAA